MFMKKPRHRIFDYQPRFYDPLNDADEKKKRKLGFRSYRTQTKKKGSIVKTVLIFLLVLLAIYLLNK